MQANPYLPQVATVVERRQESETIFTLCLKFEDEAVRRAYRFAPGQFNMVYLYGVGEVAISIVSDPEDNELFEHTIRIVGRVTEGLATLQPGDSVGIRGPFGRGWPLAAAEGKDVLVVTGGLGCAPVVSVIHYVMRRRERYGKLTIVQGVKHSADLIYRKHYEVWSHAPNTEVLIAADASAGHWAWHVGPVTELLAQARLGAGQTVAMMCGPEGMMIAAAKLLLQRGMAESALHFSTERNMHCAVGHCGHCQFGGKFVCRNGPVFAYDEIKTLLGIRGF